MLFQAFENDIELRLELQFLHKKPLCIFKDIFLHDGYVQLASGFKNFHKFIKLTSKPQRTSNKMLVFLSLKYWTKKFIIWNKLERFSIMTKIMLILWNNLA